MLSFPLVGTGLQAACAFWLSAVRPSIDADSTVVISSAFCQDC